MLLLVPLAALATAALAGPAAAPVKPTVSISHPFVTENNSGKNTPIAFDITVYPPYANSLELPWKTVDGTAKAGKDYVAKTGTFKLTMGQGMGTVWVVVKGDDEPEADESFGIEVTTSPSLSPFPSAKGEATIIDDEPPSISIGDVTVKEGDSGEKQASIPVVFSRSVIEPKVTFKVKVAGGTATTSVDYVNPTGPGGLLSLVGDGYGMKIPVFVVGDTTPEPDETILVEIKSVKDATIKKKQAVVTIKNDDSAPATPGRPSTPSRGSKLPTVKVSAWDPEITEGNASGKAFAFIVELSAPAAQTVKVQYQTLAGTAKPGSDYVAQSGTVEIEPGQTTALPIVIEIVGDTVAEPDEEFSLLISNPVGASLAIGAAKATVKIVNDDGVPGRPAPRPSR